MQITDLSEKNTILQAGPLAARTYM